MLLLGCGLPRRGFKTPPGCVKRLGGGFTALFDSSACSCLAYSASRATCSCLDTLAPLGFRCDIAFVTRMISPSRSPNERIVASVISGKMVSSILSFSNDDAYLVQSSRSHPADRKNSNQSILGIFFGCRADPDNCGASGFRAARGTLSSEALFPEALGDRLPLVISSTYSMSSTDIFSVGTSTTTPLILCSLSLPLLNPKNAASTRN
jgi:hypothetical protein